MAYIEWLHRGKLSKETAGGKGASLSDLLSAGFAVPLGFCVNAEGYRRFSEASQLDSRIGALLVSANPEDRPALIGIATEAQAIVASAALPDDLREQVAEAYDELVAMSGLACAVRSSAVAEDGAAASFAGLYESFLNVQGVIDVMESIKACYVSLWSERALRYRATRHASDPDEAMAVVVMGLVQSEVSGVAFTAHPVNKDRDMVIINSSWGLGEAIVSGRVTPDSFVIRKSSFELLEREIYPKELAIFSHPDGGGTIELQLEPTRAEAASLSDDDACAIARVAAKVEAHYGRPQDIEFGIAGGQIFVLQSRPITTL